MVAVNEKFSEVICLLGYVAVSVYDAFLLFLLFINFE